MSADTRPDSREPLGRLVHETRLAHEADRAAAEGRVRFLLGSWEERAEHQRELDMRIGSAVAAEARRDAGEELARLRKQLIVLAAHLPVLRHALEFTLGYGEARKDCRETLDALDEVWPF